LSPDKTYEEFIKARQSPSTPGADRGNGKWSVADMDQLIREKDPLFRFSPIGPPPSSRRPLATISPRQLVGHQPSEPLPYGAEVHSTPYLPLKQRVRGLCGWGVVVPFEGFSTPILVAHFSQRLFSCLSFSLGHFSQILISLRPFHRDPRMPHSFVSLPTEQSDTFPYPRRDTTRPQLLNPSLPRIDDHIGLVHRVSLDQRSEDILYMFIS